MVSQLDELGRLQAMLADNLITSDEFITLTAALLEQPLEGGDQPGSESPQDGSQHEKGKVPSLAKAALVLGVVSIFLGGTFGALAWLTVVVSVWGVFSLRGSNGRWMAWTGLVLGILFSFVNANLNGHLDAAFGQGQQPEGATDISTVSTLGQPEPTLPAERTTSYPEHLIVGEVQGEWRSIFGSFSDDPPSSAEVLDSLRHMCWWLDTATAAGESQPVFRYWEGMLEDYPEWMFRKYFSFQFNLAVAHYCPEYTDEWSSIGAQIAKGL